MPNEKKKRPPEPNPNPDFAKLVESANPYQPRSAVSVSGMAVFLGRLRNSVDPKRFVLVLDVGSGGELAVEIAVEAVKRYRTIQETSEGLLVAIEVPLEEVVNVTWSASAGIASLALRAQSTQVTLSTVALQRERGTSPERDETQGGIDQYTNRGADTNFDQDLTLGLDEKIPVGEATTDPPFDVIQTGLGELDEPRLPPTPTWKEVVADPTTPKNLLDPSPELLKPPPRPKVANYSPNPCLHQTPVNHICML